MKRWPAERRRRIVDLLAQGRVAVPDLARELGVSEITIRRDLAGLNADGKLLRVYGGAVPNQRVAYEFSFKEKEDQRPAEKEAIGRAAAGLVTEQSTVFLDTGTTTLAVARALQPVKPRVIVTVNLCIASEYVGCRETRVLVPGGELGGRSPDLLGEWTLQTLADVTVDVAFLGCDSVDPSDGFYAATPESAAVTRLMLSRSAKAYLVADHSKFGRRSAWRIAPLGKLTGVVADGGLDARHRRAVRRLGLDLLLTGDQITRL